MRAQIASRLERLGTLDKLAKEMPGSREGNGWDPSKIVETRMRVIPRPLDRLARKAISPGIWQRVADLFRPTHAMSRLAGPPAVVYLPMWYAKGYHECFYLRETNYQIRVEKDVVAVEVDGETRDLMIEAQETDLIPETLKRTLKRFSRFLTGERRYFNLGHATELAVRKKEAELCVTSDGREIDSLDKALPSTWKTQRVFDIAHLNVEGTTTGIATSTENKEKVIQRFRERLVEMPSASKQILSNSFQIEELTEYYIPYVHFPVVRGGKLDHMIINGTSAEISDAKIVACVKRQLGF